MKSIVLIAIALFLSAAYAEKRSFDSYQSIIDRQMFGPLPTGFDPTKSPDDVQKSSGKEEKLLTQEQEKLQSSIHFSVINVTPAGETEVGFTDNTDPKAPRHYYLKVGEERDGWMVKNADPNKASTIIAKGDIEIPLSLGENSAKSGGAPRAGGAAPAAPTSGAARRPGFLSGGLFGESQTQRAKHLRNLQRKQEEKAAAEKQKEEQAAKDAERQALAEQEKVQEAERAEHTRQQLQAIQEEMKKLREAKAAEAAKGESDANNEAE